MTKMTEYVAGFMFDSCGRYHVANVALIKKNRPKWQAGLLNGIGGHIEDFDLTPACAMAREFYEETGMTTEPLGWKQFAVLSGDDFKVHFFATTGRVRSLVTKTDEEVVVLPVTEVGGNAVSNLVYLIPMAIRSLRGNNEVLIIQET